MFGRWPGRRQRTRALLTATVLLAVGLLLVPGVTLLASDLRPSGVPAGSDAGASSRPTSIQVAPAFQPAPGFREVGPLPAAAPIVVAVGLAPSSLASLEGTAQAVNDPRSPSYHQFLTPAEVAARFGPSTGATEAARSYFAGFGLTVTGASGGFLLTVSGRADAMGQAFHTSFVQYRGPQGAFYSHPTPAQLPAGLPWTGAVGLGNESRIRPAAIPLGPVAPSTIRPQATCQVNPQLLTPCVYHIAYDYAQLLANGTNGTGYNIGIVDAFDSAAPEGFLVSNFQSFTSAYGLPSGNLHIAYPIPDGNLYNTTPSDGWAAEEALDMQWARASAPGAGIVFAPATNSNAGIYGAVNWLVTQGNVQVISLSWGEPDVGVYNSAVMPCSSACNASSDGSYGLLHPVIMAAAAEGITVLAASGDCGSAGGTNGIATNYPASDPWALGVGGTTLTVDPSTGAWSSESAWSGNSTGATGNGCQNLGGSGGGFSPFPRPYWQSGTGLPVSNNLRGVPDVSANAATPTVIYLRGSPAAVGGTSLATPVWAGFVAVGDQLAGKSLGFVDPSLYTVLRGTEYGSAFRDIVQGSNGFSAHVGWDPVTGIGTPQLATLLPLLARPSISPSNLFLRLTASTTSGSAPLTVNFATHASGGVTPYDSYNFVFGDGNSTPQTGGSVSYTYTNPGVYNATAVVFDHEANSSVAAPIVIVVGAGPPLVLSLRASRATGPVGTAVTFWANVTGGIAAYTLDLWFGDGTSSLPVRQTGTHLVVSHTYGFAGGFCAAATVQDAGSPTTGGGSLPLAVQIGAGSRPICATGPAISSTFSSNRTAADLPGDLPLRWNVSGGVAPLTTWLNSTDPYASLCQCGIFRAAGNQTLQLYANDSVGNRSVQSLGVTLFPALQAIFAASTLVGPAPLAVTFSASALGGHLASAANTAWSFGNGNGSVGATAAQTYGSPGEYLAVASLSDAGGGNASEAFLIDVTPASGAPLGASGTITPAVRTYVGEPTYLNVTGTGGSGPYGVRWNFSDGSSAFGPAVVTTIAPASCTVVLACPLFLNLTVRDSVGAHFAAPVTLDPFFAGAASALSVHLAPGAGAGTTPFRFSSTVVAAGMPGTQVRWSFGDGGTASGQAIHHYFLRPGNFTVRANVTDASGETWTVSQAVTVNGSVIQPLAVHLTAANRTCVAPCVFHLAANVSGGVGPYNLTWSGHNGTIPGGPFLNITSATPGVQNVTATATDALGENVTDTVTLTTYQLTLVNVTFTASPTTLNAGDEYTAHVRVDPVCVRWSLTNCTTGGVPVVLFELGTVPPHGQLYGTSLGALAPGVNYTFHLHAAAFTGTLPFQARASGPYYWGNATVLFQVGAAPPSTFDAAAYGLIALGIVVGIAAACAIILFERGRRTPPPPPPSPPVSPPANPPWVEPPRPPSNP